MTACICHAAIPDDRTLCENCADQLNIHLGNVPAWVEELETTLAGTRSPRLDNSRGGEGLHFNTKAGDLLRTLHTELRALAWICVKDGVRHQSPNPEPPKETASTSALSRWLLWRVDGLTTHHQAPTYLRRLYRISDQITHLIDIPPARVYLGRCNECPGEVFAIEGQPLGTCTECAEQYDSSASRATLEAALDEHLCTLEELAGMVITMGLSTNRLRVEETIGRWVKKGRLIPHGSNPPLYAYKEARPLIYSQLGQKSRANV